MRGQHGTTSSETGSSDGVPLASPDSVDFPSSIPQFDVNSTVVDQDLTEEPGSPERSRSVTPKSSNKRFDFSDQDLGPDEEAEDDDYMVFEDAEDERQVSPQNLSPMHQEESQLGSVSEVVNVDNTDLPLSTSNDDFSISTKDGPSDSSSDSSLQDGQGHEETEIALIAMRDTILQQQENLQELAIKNQKYRDRLAASQNRVHALCKNHLGSMDAIVRLQFERESFEAEALLLREELKKIRKEFTMLNRNRAGDKVTTEQLVEQLISPIKATSEIRWTRAQGSILYQHNEADDQDQRPVEEPFSPYNNSSPRYASNEVEAPARIAWEENAPTQIALEENAHLSLVSRDVKMLQTNSYTESPTVTHGRASNLRSSKHASSFPSQGSSKNTSNESVKSTPPSPRKTVRFCSTDENAMERNVDMQHTQRPVSPIKRLNEAKKLEVTTLDLQIHGENESDNRYEVTQQALTLSPVRHTFSHERPGEFPSVGDSDRTSSNDQSDRACQPIADDNLSVEIASFLRGTSHNHASPHSVSEEPRSDVQQPNRPLQSSGARDPPSTNDLDDQFSFQQTRTSRQNSPAQSDPVQSTRQDCEATGVLGATALTKPASSFHQNVLAPRPSRPPRTRPWEHPTSQGMVSEPLKDRTRSSNPPTTQSEPLKDRTRSSNPPTTQSGQSEKDQPMGDSLMTSKPSQDQNGGAPHSRTPQPKAYPSHLPNLSPTNDQAKEDSSPTDAEKQQLSPRSRYLAAVTRPFPANSTIMLSKVRDNRGPSIRTAPIQPRQIDASHHQTSTKPQAIKSAFLENQRRTLILTQSGESSKPVNSEPDRVEERATKEKEADVGKTMEQPNTFLDLKGSSSSPPSGDGSKSTKIELRDNTMHSLPLPNEGLNKFDSEYSQEPEVRRIQTLEEYRDLYRTQNPPRDDVESKPKPLLGPTSPRESRQLPISPTGQSALLRKATQRVRNREGKDGSSDLKRQLIKIKKQATAPTMSFAEANAELRWVKAQQNILASMKVDVVSHNMMVQKSHTADALADPEDIEDLNRRVNTVRMQLIKATLEANEEREARDDVGFDRDDLDIHYGRDWEDSRERR